MDKYTETVNSILSESLENQEQFKQFMFSQEDEEYTPDDYMENEDPAFSMTGEVDTEEESTEANPLMGFFNDEEIPYEDQESEGDPMKSLGLKDEDLDAITVAGKLATKAGGFGSAGITQNRMNAAYGELMRKVAGKVSKAAKAIK